MGLRRLRAVFGIDTEDVDKLVDLAIAIVAAMKKAQSTYSAPNPPLSVLESQIEDVVSLKPLVRNKTPGASATLRKKRLVLLGSLESERLYVQTLADAAPSQEDAMAIIQNAALKVGEAPVYARGALEIKQGQLSGSVDLAAHYRLLVDKPKGRRNFIWEYSTNGGQTWIRSATTPLANHTIANLPPLTVCEFRVALHDRNGQSAWSPVVSFIVH